MNLRPSWRLLAVLPVTIIVGGYLFVFGFHGIYEKKEVRWLPGQEEYPSGSLQNISWFSCTGPRGRLLEQSLDDQLRPRILDVPYAAPLGGSYDALGLEKSWMTMDDRYGPYTDDDTSGSARSPVRWESVNWSALQDECLQRNEPHFWNIKNITAHSTLSLRSQLQRLRLTATTHEPRSSRHSAGRTAIVLRSYAGYNYTREDFTNIRSMIVETALLSGGKYAVFLLVDMKNQYPGIFQSATKYNTALKEVLPPELQSIAVLWNEELLRDWYPLVGEYSTSMQMFQALQLFAQVYDGYDHYWQWEMDARLTGNALNYFDSLSNFARNEPRKQAFERASFRYMPAIHGTYSDLLTAVNTSVEGRGTFSSLQIPEVSEPFGPNPPTADPLEDNFEWGVGDDADFITSVPCKPLPETSSWLYKDYVFGFMDGASTPRIFCSQATSRISWNLLNVVHAAQTTNGLRLASESTMPSFALWHGFKVSQPPQPWFLMPPHDDASKIDEILNGGPPKAEHKGFAEGTSSYDVRVLDDFNRQAEQNWWWRSRMPTRIMRAWSGEAPGDEGKLPYPLIMVDGKVYAPNMALHPFKTNRLANAPDR